MKMTTAEYSEIWHNTIGQTLHITEGASQITDDSNEDTAKAFAEAASLSDDEIWKRIQAGTL